VVVGFTGSRQGMTAIQRDLVSMLLTTATEAHHGDCIGADEEFHELARRAGVPVVIHPPKAGRWRAYCEGAVKVMAPADYLIRNRHIVEASELLIGAPKENQEPDVGRGQGTWSCIRYARRHRPLTIVWPDGRKGVMEWATSTTI
jgi:hypothetical protein